MHFGRPVHHFGNLYSMAGSLLQEFLATQEFEPALPLPPILQKWHPPEADHFKLNFDATVFNSLNLAGIAIIARDWHGVVIGALSMPIPLTQSVNEVEAIACRKAIQFARELRLQKVTFEGNSSVVINVLSQGPCCFSAYGNFIDDILSSFVNLVMLKDFVMWWLMFLRKR